MFAQQYQNGSHIMLLEAKGQRPLDIWNVNGAKIDKIYDKTLKTYVFDLTGNQLHTIKCPITAQGLGITQNYLGFQLFLPQNQPLAITISVLTQQRTRIRLQFSTSVRKISVSNLLARIPLHAISGTWSLLVFDLFEIVRRLFGQTQYQSVYSVEISPYCTLLRLFSLLQPPIPTLELFSYAREIECMKNSKLPLPPFSRRMHAPLDEKLIVTQQPMHCQLFDEFYLFVFEQPGVDVSVRDQQAIIKARADFNIVINQKNEENYEIAKKMGHVGAVREASGIEQIYQQAYASAVPTTSKPIQNTPRAVMKTPVNKAKYSKIPTPFKQGSYVSAVKTAIEGFNASQEEAHRLQKESYIVLKNAYQSAQQGDKIKANLARLPQALAYPEEIECNEDLTVSGVAVRVHAGAEGQDDEIRRLRDNVLISGHARRYIADGADGIRASDMEAEEQSFPLGEGETADPESASGHRNATDKGQEHSSCGQCGKEDSCDKCDNYSHDPYVEYKDDKQNDQSNGELDLGALDAEIPPPEDEQQGNVNPARNGISSQDIPQDNVQEEQYLIPDPADAQYMPDPVAFGLYYDPVSKCYYEKDE